MDNFDAHKWFKKQYLAESKPLKERIDPNSEIADYVKGMFNSSVYDYEGIQSDVWSKAEYAATSPGEGSVFMDLVDHLKSVGGKDVLEGDPDIYLKLLPNEDIQWKAEIILNPQDDLRYLQENRLEGLIREKLLIQKVIRYGS